jgi:hypothetical protein
MIIGSITKRVVQLTLETLLKSEDFDKILDRLASKIASNSTVVTRTETKLKETVYEKLSEDTGSESMEALAKASTFFDDNNFSVRNDAFEKNIVKSDKEKNNQVMENLRNL